MLRISKLADYATLVMVEMAKTPSVSHNAVLLAEETHIALPTVRKVLKMLQQAGLVHSSRGVSGGYALASAPADIHLVAIVEAMDGPLAMTECCGTESGCQQTRHCHTTGHWQLINQQVRRALASVSLEQMLQHTLQATEHYTIPVSALRKKVNHGERH